MKKRDKKPRKRPGGGHMFSGLSAHKQEGTTLRSPLNRMEKMMKSSWQDDHMPLMLWAALLTEVLPRPQYLACFRELLTHCHPWFKEGSAVLERPSQQGPSEEGINYTLALDLETLSLLPSELFVQFVRIPLKHPLGYAAFRPMLLLKSIPGIERWREAMKVEPQDSDWETLAGAVAGTLDHQSERATDIRWFKLMLPVMAGKMHFPREMHEYVDELLAYPNKGDLRSVRPSIRANEMTLRRSPVPEWVPAFWKECADQTTCMDPTDFDAAVTTAPTRLTAKNVLICRRDVTNRFLDSRSSERVDPRLDSAFGLVLYGLSVIEEVGASARHEGILGRLGLRALVEALITLKYLAAKDDPTIWSAWRVYGAGQAKLAFLKAQEITGDLPGFYEEEELRRIANEDTWQEFLDIDVGNWARSNLRTLAIDCGAKDLYDSHYSWTSTFVHAHWGAVRDTNFITCHNPLHRLHRIPRLLHRRLSSMEQDAVQLVNEMLDILDNLFPGADPIGRLALLDDQTVGSAEPQTAQENPAGELKPG